MAGCANQPASPDLQGRHSERYPGLAHIRADPAAQSRIGFIMGSPMENQAE